MKLFTLFAVISLFTTSVISAQTVLHYNFNNSLNEKNGVGPALTVLGNTGEFVTDTLSEIEGNNKTVYRFEQNSGLQFNNTAAGNFLKGSYTIEIYFVFDELSSWKRVVDWKNRKTDQGAYVYYGKLNFYNIITSDEAPVVAGEYTYYVITRDSITNKVLIYTDAQEKVEFVDTDGDAVIDEDGFLNFFYDDLIVPNEASSGAVALINLYSYVLDSGDVVNSWNNIAGTVFGVKDRQAAGTIRLSPNPASDFIQIERDPLWQETNLSISMIDMQGRKTNYSMPEASGRMIIPVAGLPRGMYYLQIIAGNKSYSSKVLLR